MKNFSSQMAHGLLDNRKSNFIPVPNGSADGQGMDSATPSCAPAAFATRIRDIEEWFCPLPTHNLSDQEGFLAFYELQSYELARFHYLGSPVSGIEALYLASASLGSHYLPGAQEALDLAALLGAPVGALEFHRGLLHLARGHYEEARQSFELVANCEPLRSEAFFQWISARKLDCQAILEQL